MENKIERYKENRIVTYLLDNGYTDMNKIWTLAFEGKFNRSEMKQFYKLIGYSKCGFNDIDFTRFNK